MIRETKKGKVNGLVGVYRGGEWLSNAVILVRSGTKIQNHKPNHEISWTHIANTRVTY